MKEPKKISTIFILAAGTLWGLMGLFVRSLAVDGLSSVEIVFFRTVAAAVIMGILLLYKDKSLFKIRLKDSWCFVGTGIISLTFFNICYFTTIQMTSMAVAAILLYTSPIFVVLLSALLFKERITRVKIIAMIIAFAGCVCVTGVLSGDKAITPFGIIIGVCSGLGYALYSIFGRYALDKKYQSETISFYTFVFSSIGLLIASPFISPIGVTIGKITKGHTLRDILLIIGIAIFATVLPYLFYTKGLSGVENGKAGIMASIEPVVAALLGILVYKESLSVSTIIGIGLVLLAIVLLNLNFDQFWRERR